MAGGGGSKLSVRRIHKKTNERKNSETNWQHDYEQRPD
jgi:hypothetical protein